MAETNEVPQSKEEEAHEVLDEFMAPRRLEGEVLTIPERIKYLYVYMSRELMTKDTQKQFWESAAGERKRAGEEMLAERNEERGVHSIYRRVLEGIAFGGLEELLELSEEMGLEGEVVSQLSDFSLGEKADEGEASLLKAVLALQVHLAKAALIQKRAYLEDFSDSLVEGFEEGEETE